MPELGERLAIVCTDRGQHGMAELGAIQWEPVREDGDDDVRIWGANDQGDLVPVMIRENTRQTRGGSTKHRERLAAEWVERPDGGHTLQVKCRRCGRHVPLRDDTLDKFKDYPGRTMDCSLLGR